MFGLQPWHFGGDDVLTYREAAEYLRQLDDVRRERQRSR
jgi:hypothetical protein